MRFGLWSYCLHRDNFDNNPCNTFSPCANEDRRGICSPAQYGYYAEITHESSDSGLQTFTLTQQWTGALLVLTFSTVAIFGTLGSLFMPRPSLWVARFSLFICFCALVVGFLFCYTIQNGLQRFDDFLSPNVEFGAGLELLIVSFILLVLEERARWCIRRKEAQSALLPTTTTSESRLDNAASAIALSPIERVATEATLAVPPPAYMSDSFEKSSFECAICMGDELKVFAMLPCRHTFCSDCIFKSLKRSKRCPLCNAETHARDIQSFRVT